MTFSSFAPNDTVTRGRDRNRFDELRQTGIAAAFISHTVHELLSENQSLQILVRDLNGLFEHLAETLKLFQDPFPALRPEFRLLKPGGQRDQRKICARLSAKGVRSRNVHSQAGMLS